MASDSILVDDVSILSGELRFCPLREDIGEPVIKDWKSHRLQAFVEVEGLLKTHEFDARVNELNNKEPSAHSFDTMTCKWPYGIFSLSIRANETGKSPGPCLIGISQVATTVFLPGSSIDDQKLKACLMVYMAHNVLEPLLKTVNSSYVMNWANITWLSLSEGMASKYSGIATALLVFDPGGNRSLSCLIGIECKYFNSFSAKNLSFLFDPGGCLRFSCHCSATPSCCWPCCYCNCLCDSTLDWCHLPNRACGNEGDNIREKGKMNFHTLRTFLDSSRGTSVIVHSLLWDGVDTVIGFSFWNLIWMRRTLCSPFTFIASRLQVHCTIFSLCGATMTRGRVVRRKGWNEVNEQTFITFFPCLCIRWDSVHVRLTSKLFHCVVNGLDPPMIHIGTCDVYTATYLVPKTFNGADLTHSPS